MRRSLLVASLVSVFSISCGDEENRARPVPSQPVDSALPVVEAGNDTGTPGNDSGNDAADTGTPGDSTITDTSSEDTTPMGDATFSDIPSTKDTAIDAIMLEAGGGDTSVSDTAVPDALMFFDTAGEDVDAR